MEGGAHLRAYSGTAPEQRPAGKDGANEYVSYDGPPFANGLPHYGHLLTGFVKDIVPRYQTMRGRRVERRFGWDCHGLPAEQEAEKVLGVNGGKEIAALGMAKFNDACRAAALKYSYMESAAETCYRRSGNTRTRARASSIVISAPRDSASACAVIALATVAAIASGITS